MNHKYSMLTAATLLGAASLSACGDTQGRGDLAEVGHVEVGLTVPDAAKYDVASAHFVVVPQGGSCSDAPIAQTTALIEDEGLIDSLDPTDTGLRAFVDGLMAVPPGTYRVCVTLLQENGQPSAMCERVEDDVTVVTGQTTEIALFSECNGEGTGLVDVAVGLNDAPVITNLSIGPSKFITTCETATVTVTATDRNKDELSYFWQLRPTPVGGSLVGLGPTATFTSGTAGSYEATVTVTDALGATTSLTFPIHVTQSDVECDSGCPAGSVDAAGACWVVANSPEIGTASCERVGLVGAAIETGMPWTAEMMTAVTAALGCTNRGVQSTAGGFEAPSLYFDRTADECFTPGFTVAGDDGYVNAPFNHGFPSAGPAAVHMCQHP